MTVDASPLLAGMRSGPDTAPTSAAGGLASDAKRGERAGLRFDAVCQALDDDFESFTREPAKHDGSTRRLYIGSYRAAKLNVGDCVASGVAKTASATLLFEGNDFSRSDTKPALKA